MLPVETQSQVSSTTGLWKREGFLFASGSLEIRESELDRERVLESRSKAVLLFGVSSA